MTPATATGANVRFDAPVSPVNGISHHGDQHRVRKSSLSGDVRVERIGVIDRGETFKEATEEINEETERKRR